MTDHVLPKEAAHALLDEGFQPVIVARGTKRPTDKGWQTIVYDHDLLDESWPNGPSNLGVNLGTPSGGLIDVDCDSPETIAAASLMLGEASVQSGRGVAAASHYWFRVKGDAPKTMKLTDPTDGSMLIELRSTGAQTVIPPSVHPDGDPYRWLTPLTSDAVDEVTSEYARQIVRTVGAAGLLARHWPKKGSRHLAHLALCGGLLRGPDGKVNPEWREQAHGFARLVVSLAGDDWWERDGNVDTTIASLESGLPTRGWTTLTEYVEPKVVWTAREWLGLDHAEDSDEDLEYEEVSPDVDWNRVLLGDAIKQGIPDPDQLIGDVGLLYRGEVHTIQSAGGSGKTLIALWLLMRTMDQGERVMFVDEENGVNEIARRLVSLGADPDVLDDLLIYYAMPSVNWADSNNARRLLQVCDEEEVALVLFDSVMDMMSSSGFEENDNSGFNQMYEGTGKALKQAGVTVLFLDHLSKSSSFQARGASAKFDQSSVVWGVKVDQKFDALTPGKVTLKRRKGRLAVVEQEIGLEIVPDGEGRTTIRTTERVNFVVGDDRSAKILDEIGDYVREHGRVTRTEACDATSVRKKDALDAYRDFGPPDGIRAVTEGRTTWLEVDE